MDKKKKNFKLIIKSLVIINIIILILGYVYLNQNIDERKIRLNQDMDLYQKEKEILENTINLQKTKNETLTKNKVVLTEKIEIMKEEIKNTNEISEAKLILEEKIKELNVLTASQGNILVAEPFMQDDYFKRAVVLLAEKNEEGTVGFILNEQLNLQLKDVIRLIWPDINIISEIFAIFYSTIYTHLNNCGECYECCQY